MWQKGDEFTSAGQGGGFYPAPRGAGTHVWDGTKIVPIDNEQRPKRRRKKKEEEKQEEKENG